MFSAPELFRICVFSRVYSTFPRLIHTHTHIHIYRLIARARVELRDSAENESDEGVSTERKKREEEERKRCERVPPHNTLELRVTSRGQGPLSLARRTVAWSAQETGQANAGGRKVHMRERSNNGTHETRDAKCHRPLRAFPHTRILRHVSLARTDFCLKIYCAHSSRVKLKRATLSRGRKLRNLPLAHVEHPTKVSTRGESSKETERGGEGGTVDARRPRFISHQSCKVAARYPPLILRGCTSHARPNA